MAQRKPEEQGTLDQVLKLVDTLSLEEQRQLRLKLNAKAWGEKWDTLVSEIREQNKALPPLSEEEIFAECKAIKNDIRAECAQGNR
jgi:hypothetical protein